MHAPVRISTAQSKWKPMPLITEDLVKFKGFARKLALSSPGNKGVLLCEWASSVHDLHRVLDVTRSLYLLHQSHNEILLRVGVELVTSKSAKKIFQWTDGDWYSDDSRREWFRDVVQSHLNHVLETCSGEIREDERLATANLKVKQAQSELASALQKCESAEAVVEQTRCKVHILELDLNAKSEDLANTQVQLEEAQVQLRAAREKVCASEAKLRDSRKVVTSLEAQVRDADARRLCLEEDLARHKAEIECLRGDMGGRRKELEQLQAETASLQNKKEMAVKASQAAVEAAQVAEKKALGAAQLAEKKALGDLHRKATELQTWVAAAEAAKSQAAELRGVVTQLEEKVAVLEAENGSSAIASTRVVELEEALTDLKSRFASLDEENNVLHRQLETALETPIQPAVSTPVQLPAVVESKADHRQPEIKVTVRPPTGEVGMQTETVKQISRAPSKVQPPVAESHGSHVFKSAIEETRGALRKLESENRQLKSTLEGLQTKLKQVVESCHGSGVASHLSDVLSNTSLKHIKVGGVWDRLYGDALDRVDRMELRHESAQAVQCAVNRIEQRQESANSVQCASGLRTASPQSERSFADEREHCSPAKIYLTSVSARSDASHRLFLTPDVPNGMQGSHLDSSPGDPLFHANAAGVGNWAQKSLALPPCLANRRLPKCASSCHLRSTRLASKGKLATSSSVVNLPGGEDSASASGQRKRQNTTVSLPFLHGVHGHQLKTLQGSCSMLPK